MYQHSCCPHVYWAILQCYACCFFLSVPVTTSNRAHLSPIDCFSVCKVCQQKEYISQLSITAISYHSADAYADYARATSPCPSNVSNNHVWAVWWSRFMKHPYYQWLVEFSFLYPSENIESPQRGTTPILLVNYFLLQAEMQYPYQFPPWRFLWRILRLVFLSIFVYLLINVLFKITHPHQIDYVHSTNKSQNSELTTYSCKHMHHRFKELQDFELVLFEQFLIIK